MHGIGGRSVDQVKRGLSYREVQLWAAYRRKRGSLNWGMRIEHAAALVVTTYINAHRRKGAPMVPIHAYMPHAGEQEISLEEAMRTWR